MADQEPPTVFINEPSQHLKCPVCQHLYTDPVINIACGHTFCVNCARGITSCPADGNVCDKNQLVVNRLVVGQIEDLLIYCQYGVVKEGDNFVPDPTGCQEKIQLGSRSKHESICEFIPVLCPNKNCLTEFRKSELEDHLKVCVKTQCSHEIKGCEFEGNKEEIRDHEKVCGYRGLPRSTGNDLDVRTKLLEESNKELHCQVSTLTKKLEVMEETNTALRGQLSDCLGELQAINQKYDTLYKSVDQLTSLINRRSYGSPGSAVEGRRRSSSSSSFRKSLSGSPPASTKYEKWAMPFQFKCIGTLRKQARTWRGDIPPHRGHKDVVWCMATRKKKLFTAGADCTIKVWDLDSLQKGCTKTIQGHSKAIQCMTVDGNFLYTGGHDNALCCWSLDDYDVIKKVENAHDNIICAMVSVGDYLFTSSFSLIKIWETKTLTLKNTIPGLHHWVRALALNPERDKLYSGSHNTIDIWSVTEPFTLKGKVDHQFGSVYSLAITSNYIIAGTYNRNVQVFNRSTFEHAQALRGHVGVVTAVVASPCGGFCFSCSSDQTIQIWNLENMLPIQKLQRHEGSVNTLVLHGDFLFSGSEDKEIKVFMYFQMQMGFALNG